VTRCINIEILFENLQLVGESIEYHEVKSIAEAVALTKKLTKFAETPEWATPTIFPLVENLPTVLPGQRYGHRIEGKTIAETWIKIIHRIKTTAVLRPTGYDGQWQELIDQMAVVTDDCGIFSWSRTICRSTASSWYTPQMLDDNPYSEGIKYTYRQRMRSWFGHDQIEEVIAKIINEIDAGSAVINLWDSGGSNRRTDGSSDHHVE
jgi:thymidylate synthase